ncbi:hypothetical protein QQX98_010909 [Neonectria punicea]|uniref:Uncharacterized protein n=1 Tax=Neonectria punicea TaxID=979145 RepID=A0ABR1GNE4_9HYPO
MMDNNLSDVDSVKAIGQWAAKSSQTEIHTIMVEKKRFNQLCAKYYPQGAPSNVKNAWNALMTVGQKYQKALVQYQKALVHQAQVEAYFAQSKLAISHLQSDTSTFPGVKTRLFKQMYDESYVVEKARVDNHYALVDSTDQLTEWKRSSAGGRLFSGLSSALVPNGFRVQMMMSPAAGNCFNGLGSTPGDIAKAFVDSSSTTFLNSVHLFHKICFDQYSKMTEEEQGSMILSDFTSGHSHSARTAGMITLWPEDAKTLKWDQGLLIARLKAIPNGAMFITGKHQQAI